MRLYLFKKIHCICPKCDYICFECNCICFPINWDCKKKVGICLKSNHTWPNYDVQFPKYKSNIQTYAGNAYIKFIFPKYNSIFTIHPNCN